QLSGRGAARDLHLGGAAERRHIDLRTERRLHEADRDLAHHVVALPHEQRMLVDVEQHVEVPGWAAVGPSLAFAPELEPRARVDTRRDLDAQLIRPPFDPRPPAGLAGIGDDRALPVAVTARLGDREEALLEAHLTRAAALWARPRRGARPGAVPATRLAGSEAGHGDRLLAAEGGFLEADLERVAQVLAAS